MLSQMARYCLSGLLATCDRQSCSGTCVGRTLRELSIPERGQVNFDELLKRLEIPSEFHEAMSAYAAESVATLPQGPIEFLDPAAWCFYTRAWDVLASRCIGVASCNRSRVCPSFGQKRARGCEHSRAPEKYDCPVTGCPGPRTGPSSQPMSKVCCCPDWTRRLPATARSRA